ncbi:MAG: hypothetical protein AAF721_06540, partial [Myxococcota bacterium]
MRLLGVVVGLGGLVLGCREPDGAESSGGAATEGATSAADAGSADGDTSTTPSTSGSGADGANDAASTGTTGAAPISCDDDELTEMFVRYVEPFVSGALPNSCAECHMTGVDLS